MQKPLFLQRRFSPYLIPVLLFVCSYSIYSYNLEGQPWHGDEWLFNAGGIVYLDLIKNGDLLNPCWNGIGECDLLNELNDEWPQRSGHVRHILIGVSRDLAGADEGNPFAWSHFWSKKDVQAEFDIIKRKRLPVYRQEGENITLSDLAAGRALSPVFGSLTVVLAFFIGKILFNRITGLTFALILVFYSLWILNSRLAMTEVFGSFFILLAITLLVYSFKEKTFVNYKFFIFGAIAFGLAINTKLTSLEIIFLFATIILFRKSFNKKLNFHVLVKRKEILGTLFLVLVFSTTTITTVFLSNPYFYPDPVNQLLTFTTLPTDYKFLTIPSLENNNFFRLMSTVHTSLIPYFIDYYDEPFAENLKFRDYYLTWESPQTYSTIPLSLFFFIGCYYLVNKIRERSLNFAELLLLAWFTSLFVITTLTVAWVYIERFYIPLMFPIMFIAAYGLSNFLMLIKSKKEQIAFFVLFIFSHAVYALSFWERIYFLPYVQWGEQIIRQKQMAMATIQNTIDNSFVYVTTIVLITFIIIYFKNYKIQRKNFSKSLETK